MPKAEPHRHSFPLLLGFIGPVTLPIRSTTWNVNHANHENYMALGSFLKPVLEWLSVVELLEMLFLQLLSDVVRGLGQKLLCPFEILATFFQPLQCQVGLPSVVVADAHLLVQ